MTPLTAKFEKAKKRGRPRLHTDAENADLNRERNRDRFANISRIGRDIGPIPAVTDKNWTRRLKCIADPELFIVTYFGFPPFFGVKRFWAFSQDHIKVFEKAEDCIRNGGNFAYAMPRGHGKTAISLAFVIRSLLCGFRHFAMFVGAAEEHAKTSLETIREMFVVSTTLAEDWPEIVFPILSLKHQVRLQGGQVCLGENTRIHWGSDHIQLPTCPPQPTIRPEQGAGYAALCKANGLMGSGITGKNVKGHRPDFLLLDDPQTRESADSDSQCAKRERILAAMITGMAAPGTKLAAFMPCTVIRQGDMADRHLDHTKHPEWAIERCRLLKTMPTRMDLWDANKAIRTNFDPYAGPQDKARAANEATEHYIENEAAMNEGAEASWKDRYEDNEVSAIQNGMNKHADNRSAFFAELQNDPLASDLGNVVEMTKDEVATRLSGRPRLIVPHGDTRVTAFIDVQGIGLLFYLVLATRDDFTAHCIDYGTWPNQHRRYFTKSTAPTLLPNGDKGLHSGLIELGCDLLTTDYKGESGGSFMIDLLLVDSGHQSELIYEFVRQMRARGFGNRILPSKGEGPGANERKGFTEGPKTDPRERRGFEWILPPPKEARGVKLLRYNTNAWKSFLWERIAVEDGAKGSLTFFGSDPSVHRMLFDHLFAEYRDRMKSERSGREIDVWHERGNQDNDYLDCLVGAAVAASVQGAILQDVQASRPAAKVVDYAELYRQAQEAKR